MAADFEDFGTQLARFQGGAIILHGYGCRSCGHGFWVEDDERRATDPSSLACPRCGTDRLREGIRAVLDLRSSYEADRGRDVPLVINAQARGMLEGLLDG